MLCKPSAVNSCSGTVEQLGQRAEGRDELARRMPYRGRCKHLTKGLEYGAANKHSPDPG